MTMPYRQHVFISYSTKDIHFVERLRAKLRDASIPYWIDKEGLQPGTRNWEKAIRSAIQNSFMAILVASPHSVESDYVADEIDIARNVYQCDILPVWAAGDHWNACIPLGMGKSQYIDLRGESFDRNVPSLIQAIDKQRGANGEFAESIFSQLDSDVQARFGHVFFRLFALDEQERPISLRTRKGDFPSDEPTQQFIQSLIAAKLLVEIQVDEEVVLEVAHEALLRNWDRLAEWIAQATENKRLLQKLEVDAAYWAKRGKPRDQYRYIHEQEVEIKAICAQWEIELSPLEEEFLQPEILRRICEMDIYEDLESRPIVEVAFERILEIGDVAVPALIETLTDSEDAQEVFHPNWDELFSGVRCNCARALGAIGDMRAIAPLLTSIWDRDEYVAEAAEKALLQFGRRDIDSIIAEFSNPDPDLRQAVVEILGKLQDPVALPALVAALGDEDSNVISTAYDALSEFGETAIAQLFEGLCSPNIKVRRSVASFLNEFDSLPTLEPLVNVLDDSDNLVRLYAAYTLSEYHDMRARSIVTAMLNDPDDDIRTFAEVMLGKLDDQERPLQDEDAAEDQS